MLVALIVILVFTVAAISIVLLSRRTTEQIHRPYPYIPGDHSEILPSTETFTWWNQSIHDSSIALESRRGTKGVDDKSS